LIARILPKHFSHGLPGLAVTQQADLDHFVVAWQWHVFSFVVHGLIIAFVQMLFDASVAASS
jgi:hypothetical protein